MENAFHNANLTGQQTALELTSDIFHCCVQNAGDIGRL